MPDIKNFGLKGVGSDLQLGKGGIRLINESGVFSLKATNGSTDAALTASNAILSGSLTVGSDAVLSRYATGIAKFDGSAAFMAPVGDTAARPTGVAGLIRVNNDTPSASTVEYFDGTAWRTVATGGNTAALQTEIDNIETSLGAGIDSSGNFVAGGFTGAVFSTPTSFTNAIQQVADYTLAHNTLDEIFPSLANGNVIYSAGGVWTQDAPGATSGVQAYDAGLAVLAAKTSTGIMVQTAADTYESRTLVQPSAGLTISNANGIAGNPTFALANDLAALEGLTTTGYIVRTGDGTATTRAIAGTAGNIVVTNGDGVSTDTNINLDTVSQAASGNFVKVTLDSFGRVTGNTAVVTADITALVDSTYVNVSGDTMTGNLNMGSNKITGLADPTAASDAANKGYVDSVASGLSWKTAALAATTGNITLSGAQTIDGVAVIDGNRVLVKNQTTTSENGIYVVASGAWTRATDTDTAAELDGSALYVQQGTVNADTGWVETATVVTVGTDPVVYAQFSGANAYVGGTGISISGNTINANLGAGIAELPSDEIGLDLYDPSTGALILTTTGSNRSTATGAQLYLLLDGAGALAQTASGLKINAASVTNAMLVNQGVGLNADTGTSSLDLGQTLLVAGTSTQGISTSVSGQTVTITASNASSSQKGVATFNTASFDVTAGDVTIKTAGVSNAQLANSSITVTGTSGSDAVALGESLAIIGADSAISTTMGTNSLSIQLNTVDVPHGGTGRTTLATGQLLFGAGTSQVGLSSALSFNGTDVLTIGSGTFQGVSSGDVTIASTATNADINLLPNGTGKVNIGQGGGSPTVISDNTLLVQAATGLTLETVAGDTVMKLAVGTTDKVTVSGPSATQYATGLADADLVNKKYVDDAVNTSSTGDVKSVKATVSLAANGTTNIGAALPAGATILSVKVKVTLADTAALLSVGKSGSPSAYMTTGENDAQTVGLYLAETLETEAGSEQVIATVSSTAATSGSSCVIIVEFQLA